MSERKYTDEEIIRALKIHSDKESSCLKYIISPVGLCPYSGTPYCGSDMARDAFDLINRQKAEIAVLTTAVDNSTKEFLKLHDEYQDQKAEIEKLQEVNADLNESLRLAAEANKDLKAEVEEWKARANDWQNQCLKLIKELEICQEHIDQDIIYAKAIKTEAIKQFAERLKEKSGCIVAHRDGVELYTTKLYQIRATDIDSLVKEMTEGE